MWRPISQKVLNKTYIYNSNLCACEQGNHPFAVIGSQYGNPVALLHTNGQQRSGELLTLKNN